MSNCPFGTKKKASSPDWLPITWRDIYEPIIDSVSTGIQLAGGSVPAQLESTVPTSTQIFDVIDVNQLCKNPRPPDYDVPIDAASIASGSVTQGLS